MLTFTIILFCALLAVGMASLYALKAFTGPDHSVYDEPRPASAVIRKEESPEHALQARSIAEGMAKPIQGNRREILPNMRRLLDERGEAMEITSTIRRVETGEVRGEWVVAPNAVPGRRLLFIHGGAFMAGSPRSHRLLASRFSEASDAEVFSIEYRLMPEHPRLAGMDDCRSAYRWILEHGPDGKSPVETLMVAGDSAGGNMALMTVAWARDMKLRPADAVVVLSPPTDATLASPSMRKHVGSDIMQGKPLGPLVRLPRGISLWTVYAMHRLNPASPLMSPLLGDLSNLPPTLLQASEIEMFLDDSVRYANKANAQGSYALVQTWPHVLHVWQAFEVPEADEAFGEIRKFLAIHAASKAVP